MIGASSADAGAWVPEPGAGYHKLASNFFRATDFFGSGSNVEEFTNTNLSYYGEFGVAPRLAAFGTVALTRLTQTAGGNRTDYVGLGDLDLGLRYQLVTEPAVVSASLLWKLPYLYDENTALPPGNGQNDLEFRLLVGKSLGRWGYFGIENAYRIRFEEPSDEYRFLFEYGASPTDQLYVRTKLDLITSIKNGDPISQGIGNPSLNPEFDLGRIELTAGWNLTSPKRESSSGRWGVEATYTRDLYGDQTLRGNTVQLGITFVH
ncbi:MAG: hypothetical protein AAGC67_05175 [Myxococcota bacterium]